MEQAAQQAVSPAAAVLDGAAAAAPALAVAAAAAAGGGGASATAWGLLLALAAAAGNNIGKGLQKAATRGLPALTLARKEVLYAYISNPVWLGGLLLDVAGGGAMLGALAAAPVSLVQPVAAFGLVLLAAFSHFVLQERLTAQQWQGAAVATLGIVGMGISGSSTTTSTTPPDAATAAAAPAPATAAGEPPPAVLAPPLAPTGAGNDSGPSPFRVLFWFVLLLGCLGFEVVRRQRQLAAAAARRRRLGPAAVAADGGNSGSSEAAVCGVEAGCCFGFSAAAARTGFQLSSQLGYSWLLVPLGIASSLGLTSSGLVLQTQGFKHGSALVVCTTAAAASIVAGVVMGLLALSEPLPASRSMQLLLLASWAAIALGVSSMAGPTSSSSSSGRGGVLGLVKLQVSALAKAFLLLLPRGFRRRLPHGVLLWLGRGANVPGGLGLGVYLRQLIQRARGGRAGSNTGDTALSLRFYDDAAVAEVLEGLGFGSASEDLSREGWQQQQQQQDVTPAGDRVLRSTAALGLGDDGGPGLPVFGVSAAAAAPAAVEAAAVTAGLQPPAAVAVGGVGVVGQLQVGASASSMHAGSTSSPDFGGVLAPTGGRRV